MLNLKSIRLKADLSQQQLANKLGVSRSTVAMWETGSSEPDIETLSKLAGIFDISVDKLLGRDDITQHVIDDEALEIMEILHKRPEMKILFNAGRKATKEDVLKAVAIVDALRRQAEGEEDY